MISPTDAALVKRFLELIAWAVLWLFAYCAVILLPLGVLHYPALLALTAVLVYDVAKDWGKKVLP